MVEAKKNEVNEKLVLDIVKLHFDEIPKIKKFHSESSYVAELDFKDFKKVIKINTSNYDWKIAKEIQIFEILKNNGIPRPKIYFTNLIETEYPQYYIMEYLGTRNLMELGNFDSKNSKDLFKQIGVYFAKTHLIKFEAQGKISTEGILKQSFSENYKKEFDLFLINLIKLNLLSVLEISNCKKLFSTFQDSNEAVLCHRDFGPWQVIIDDKTNKINGLIDWEWGVSSCSVADFARAESLMTIFGCELKFFKQGYEEIKKLPKNYEEIKIAYKLPQLLSLLYHYTKSKDETNYNKCRKYFDELIK